MRLVVTQLLLSIETPKVFIYLVIILLIFLVVCVFGCWGGGRWAEFCFDIICHFTFPENA